MEGTAQINKSEGKVNNAGIRRDPQQSPLYKYEDIFASKFNQKKTGKSMRSMEDIFNPRHASGKTKNPSSKGSNRSITSNSAGKIEDFFNNQTPSPSLSSNVPSTPGSSYPVDYDYVNEGLNSDLLEQIMDRRWSRDLMNQKPEETPEPSTSAATPSLIVEPLEEVSGPGEERIPHKSPQNHKKKAKKAIAPRTNERNTRGSKKSQIVKKTNS